MASRQLAVLLAATISLAALTLPASATCSWTTLTNGSPADAVQLMNNLDCLAPLNNPSFTGSVGIGTTTPNLSMGVVSSVAKIQTLSTMSLDLGVNSTSALRIVNGGNVGILNTTPNALLDVAGVIRTTGVAGAPGSGAGVDMYFSSARGFIESYDYNTSANKLLDIYGSTVTIHNVSDLRLKANVLSLDTSGGLQAILALRPVSFDWKDEEMKKALGRQTGLIAQEAQKVFPSLVSPAKTQTIVSADGTKQQVSDPLTVNYEGLIVPLIKAVQEQQAEIAALKQQVDALRANQPAQK